MIKRLLAAPALAIVSALAFSACSAGQSVSPSPQTVSSHAHSWALPESSSDTLLYYTDDSDVVLLSYPQGKLVGTLTGLDYARGVCSDAKGNVFVTTVYTEAIYEYAHGGKEPIAKLEDYGYYPLGCAVDPVTGNLAVANTKSMNGGAGNVAIYTDATGKPTFYSVYGAYDYSWPAYDTNGNLYVNGNELTYMPYESSTMSKISLGVYGQGIQWDGQYLAMIDGTDKRVYRLAISGSSATVASTINFTGLFTTLGDDFVLPAGAIVMPYTIEKESSGRIGRWPYPKGGKLKRTIRKAEFVEAMTLSI